MLKGDTNRGESHTPFRENLEKFKKTLQSTGFPEVCGQESCLSRSKDSASPDQEERRNPPGKCEWTRVPGSHFVFETPRARGGRREWILRIV